MRFTRAAILMTAFVLGVALFAHATPVPKVKTLSTGGKVSKSSSGKDPLFKTSKINTATTTKAKTAPVKSTKSKTAKASSKTTKAKATAKATNAKSDAALASKPESTTKATKATNANKPAKTNPACSLPGAHRRADCAAPPAIDCTSFDTCKSCVSLENNKQCVFDKPRKKCVVASGTLNPVRDASTDTQCDDFEKKLRAEVIAKEQKLQKQAAQIFGKIRPGAADSLRAHIGSGSPNKPASGRHLFTIWKSNLVVASTIKVNPITRLANLDTSSVDPKVITKTVWLDDRPVGDTGDIYPRSLINQMCIDAIIQVLKNEGGVFRNKIQGSDTVTGKSHKIVVQGINQSRVCMAISDQSCFPDKITPEQLPLGETCS